MPGFVDSTGELGIGFVHDAGPTGEYYFPQAVGSGAAVFDLEGDGDLDLLLVQGASGSVGALLRHEADGRFVDVTEGSGLAGGGYGMGVAAGDIDNDGDCDLYLTRVGADALYRNEGGGRFVDVTAHAGIDNPGWGTAAALVDVNRDGWLDVVVANYVEYLPGQRCADGAGRQEFCGPKDFKGTCARLYLNRGEEGPRFRDATVTSGLAAKLGKGLGLAVRDFDGDGRTDIFVANDGMENFLWMQREDGIFREDAIARGAAWNQMGVPEANMGVVCDDLTGDGIFDLFVTHLHTETNTLWEGLPGGQFADMTPRSRLGIEGRGSTGFGTAAVDLDLDGELDLLIANGHVTRVRPEGSGSARIPAFWQRYADRNQLYLGEGKGRFRLAQEKGGAFSEAAMVARGLALGDINGDGVPDVVVTQIAGPARVYLSALPRQGRWLAVRAFDRALRRDAIGARIGVRVGARWHRREILPHTSYLCSHEPVAYFGIAGSPDEIVVEWPDAAATRESFPGGPADRRLTLEKGRGAPVR